MDTKIQIGTIGGIHYEMFRIDRFLKSPLYYAILKFNNGDEVQTDKVRYLSECIDHLRTKVAEEGFYG